MEAIHQPVVTSRPPSLASQDEPLILPPPPAPFPTHLLTRSTSPTQRSEATRAQLVNTQRTCIDLLSTLIPDSPTLDSTSEGSLPPADRQLAGGLTELLEVCHELELLQPSSSIAGPSVPAYGRDGEVTTVSPTQELREQLEALQQSRQQCTTAEGGRQTNGLHPSIGLVREELAWERVEVLSQALLAMLEDRSMNGNHATHSNEDAEPPSYTQNDEIAGADPAATLPSYSDLSTATSSRASSSKRSPRQTAKYRQLEDDSEEQASPKRSRHSEKMMRAFDDISYAIDRLNVVSPRLQDQRSEIKAVPKEKRGEIQARIEQEKMRELEEIWDKIERTHGMRDGQRADAADMEARRAARRKRFLESLLEHSEASRMGDQDAAHASVSRDLARARDLRERDRFLQDLVSSTEDGRLADQDANPPTDQDQAQWHKNGLSSAILRGEDDPNELVTVKDFFKPRSINGTNGADSTSRERSGSLSSDDGKSKKDQGTLKRIAGLVRRSSVGLGLRAGTSDLSNVTYVAEHQENLRAIQVILHGEDLPLKEDLTIETGSSKQPGSGVSEAMIISKRDSSLSLQIRLPSPVMPNQHLPLSIHEAHLETKLAAMPSPTTASLSSLNTLVTQALSAAELRRLRPIALCCTECDREIADLGRAIRSEDKLDGSGFKDLPSEHWAEMMEVWMCHDDPAFTAQLAQRTRDGFWPTRENVLVGGSHLLINADNVKKSTLQSEPSHSDTWNILACSCGEVLGKRRSEDGKPGAGTVRFSKWAVALLRANESREESVEPLRFPLSVFIMSDLLELAQAHASYRFVISVQDDDTDRILLWLFNPSVNISFRRIMEAQTTLPGKNGKARSRSGSDASGALKSVTKVVKAAKVFYKVVDAADHAFDKTSLPGFGHAGQVEQISYPSDVVARLVDALQDSTELYPASRRTMSGFEVGILERV